MNNTTMQSLTTLLWPEGDKAEGKQVYWLLDGARDPEIVSLLGASGLPHVSLFSGQLHPRLMAAAPHLVHFPQAAAATELLLRRGWGKAWGIFTIVGANVNMDQQRLHLKKFLRVQTGQGTLMFRYYDPRVLNVYLPTCTADGFQTFLGPVARVVCERDEGKTARTFSWQKDPGAAMVMIDIPC